MSLVHPQSSLPNGHSKSASSKSPFLNDLLSNPPQFGDVYHRSSFTPTTGVREVVPGPPSPPRSPQRKLLNLSLPNSPAIVSTSQSNGLAIPGPSSPRKEKAIPNGDLNGKEKSLPNGNLIAATIPPAANTPNAKGKAKQTSLPNGVDHTPSTSSISPKKQVGGSQSLYDEITDLSWPEGVSGRKSSAAGLVNPSMACYANATLQVILHTPPLLRIVLEHDADDCILHKKAGFCLTCNLHKMLPYHWGTQRSYNPKPVHNNLGLIKKGFNRNRQEDAHEFFRFVTDALQNTALAGLPKDLPHSVKHTSWVHRLWGGQVRSRVVCSKCLKPSDTMDTFLDLSLDCHPTRKSLISMFQGFIKEDRLEGDNKYHCENCKAKANATKSFRIAEAPPVLTLHLKRFAMRYNTYNGRAKADKFTQFIEFPEHLNIAPYMVDSKAGGTKYRLFGVTCHRGAELRYGHYTSYVRHPSGAWYHADDDSVDKATLQDALRDKTAYLLSYMRIPDDTPTPAVTPRRPLESNGHTPNGISGGSSRIPNGTIPTPSKRKRSPDEDDEDQSDHEKIPVGDQGQLLKRIGPTSPKVRRVGSPPARSAPNLFPSSLDPDTDSIDSFSRDEPNGAEEHKEGDVPVKWGYQPRPTPATVNGVTVHHPKPVRPLNKSKFSAISDTDFYGKPKSSPITRPNHPAPFTSPNRKTFNKSGRTGINHEDDDDDNDDGEEDLGNPVQGWNGSTNSPMSKNQRKKEAKRRKKLAKQERERKVPMPFNVGKVEKIGGSNSWGMQGKKMRPMQGKK